MSEENEGEDNQNETLEEEFEFYFTLTKPLVLDLPTEEDRALAAAWVQKLEAEPKTRKEKEDRLNYLKLLLFVLQRGRLSGIFARQPPSGPLQPFPQGFNVLDMGNLMLEQDDDLLYGGGDAGRVPYVMEISNDLREYVASQEVPNFGVQMYYAWSSEEPVHKWSSFDEEKFPLYILEKIKQMKSTKFEEKSQPPSENYDTEKKGCSLNLPCSTPTKKVKSPEEIEKSQGRSYLTYVGLTGRAGNFDKCDEDQDRLQRQNSSRKYSGKRKKCPGNDDGGGEEDLDNFVSGLGGELNSNNRPCLCPDPGHQTNCPSQPRRRTQFSCMDNQSVCRDSENENAQWPVSVNKPSGSNRGREQCFDNNSMAISPQRNAPSRNLSTNRRPMECAEGNSGGSPNQGAVCVCSSPPCTCPCPRVSPKTSPPMASPGGGGRVCQSPSRTCPRPAADGNMNRGRGIGTHLTSLNAPEPGTPSPYRPDMTPTGGRSTVGSDNLRPILHCYDNQNPDPALTKTIEKNDGWLPLEDGGAKFVDTEYKLAVNRDQLIARAMENKCKINARRGLFNQPQPGPSGMNRVRPQNEYQQGSPGLLSHPICEYSGSTEDESYSPQQSPQSPQSYQDQSGSPLAFPACGTRVNTITQKKPQAQPQPSCRPKSSGPSTFAVQGDGGRLANINRVLQGMKQKTESYGCAGAGASRSPANEGFGACGLTQPKSFPKQNLGGFFGGPNEQLGRNMMSGCGGYQAPPSTPQPGCSNFPNRGFGNFLGGQLNRVQPSTLPSEAYEFTLYKGLPDPRRQNEPYYQDEDDDDECDECDSTGSAEGPCQNAMEDENYKLSDQCKAALNRRSQDYYKLTEWEENEPDFQECAQDDFARQDNNPFPGFVDTPPEFVGTMLSANDTSYDPPPTPQWVNPTRRAAMKTPFSSPKNYAEISMNSDECTIGSVRTSPGRAYQRSTTTDESLTDNSTFDDSGNMGVRRNRYFERSAIAHTQASSSRPAQPVCSTPLRHHRETFKGTEEISRIKR